MAYSCCVNQRCPSNKNQGDINHRHGTEGGRREGGIPSVYQLLLLPGGYVFTSVCLFVCLFICLSPGYLKKYGTNIVSLWKVWP